MTIKLQPLGTQLIDPVKFDVSIYPVTAQLTTTGVQYEAEVTNATTTYANLFSLDTHTYFPYVKGKLAWAYVNISFEVKAGNSTPTATYQIQAKNSGASTWVDMSAATDYSSVTTAYVGKKLEGYLDLTTGTIDYAPFSLKLRFKTDTVQAGDEVIIQLKNDTVIRLVGSIEGV